ncbi:hypothetical protein N7492_001306 [Penicillium capsulatum]|uniref:Uncharacterized protein n=1 Tax=Penicillium capsulatum TaxID=69766 RepID=A0A9W9IVB0_9EURO|nr:hypothetical protein N7492_001306 [Penicillium capsulatum]KAJ6129636.1 hypothetical protein N7512_002416 [Penicillium capsulatum]
MFWQSPGGVKVLTIQSTGALTHPKAVAATRTMHRNRINKMTRSKTDIKLSLELLDSSIHSLMAADNSPLQERNQAVIKASQQLLKSRVDEVLEEITLSLDGLLADDGDSEDEVIEDTSSKVRDAAEAQERSRSVRNYENIGSFEFDKTKLVEKMDDSGCDKFCIKKEARREYILIDDE